MDAKTNVPPSVPLDEESVFLLSAVLAFYNAFPISLREHARLTCGRLIRAIRSAEMSVEDLLMAAYIGFAPLPTTYGHFITQARRINKLEPHAQSAAFRKNSVAREQSAAAEYGMTRGELKRLLASVDELARRSIGVATYEKTFDCRNEILSDTSPFAPTDRNTYSQGPLYLWDLAKAVNEHKLTNMHFDTFDGWILFIYSDNGSVVGHAIHPVAHRHGDVFNNPFGSDIWFRMTSGFPCSFIDVPEEVELAVEELANRRFPGAHFRLIPPPMIHAGSVVPSWSERTSPHRYPTEG